MFDDKKNSESCSRVFDSQWLIILTCCILLLMSRATLAQSAAAGGHVVGPNLLLVIGLRAVSEDKEEASERVDSSKMRTGQSKEKIEQPAIAEVDVSEFSADPAQVPPHTPLNSNADTPHPLSVEPSGQMLPKDRPSWIESDPDLESEIHRFVVASIPTTLKRDLDSNLEAPLLEAVNNYVNHQFGPDTHQLLHERLTASFIQTNLVDQNKTYVAEMQTGEGMLFQKWVMVEVTPEQRNQIRLWISQQLQRQRVLPLGIGLGGLLSAIGLMHLLLKRRSSLHDILKANHLQFLNHPGPVSGDIPNCNKSECRRFGMLTAITIAILVALFVASPGKSSVKKKSSENRRHEVKLQVAPSTKSVVSKSEW